MKKHIYIWARASVLKATNLAQESQNELAMYGKGVKETMAYQMRELAEKLHLLWANLLLSLFGDSVENLEGK